MTDCLSLLYTLLGELYNFVLPWGITFGSVIVGIFGLPLLVKAFKKFF